MRERPGRVVTNFFRGDRVRCHGSGQVGAVEAQTADGTVSVRFDGSEAGAPCAPADLLLLASGPLPDGILGPLADLRGSVLGGMADWDMVSATLLFRGYHAADAWLRARRDRCEDVLARLNQARDAGKRLPVGYWFRGEDRWTAREAEDGRVPGDAVWVQPPIEESGPTSPFEQHLRALGELSDRGQAALTAVASDPLRAEQMEVLLLMWPNGASATELVARMEQIARGGLTKTMLGTGLDGL